MVTVIDARVPCYREATTKTTDQNAPPGETRCSCWATQIVDSHREWPYIV